MNEFLREIGLTDAEVKVYLALLHLGVSPAGQIAAKAGLYRKNAYDALRKLSERGLASEAVEGKARKFQAKSPDNLLKYLDERQAALKEQRQRTEKELPRLQAMFGQRSPEIEAEIYRGSEGIKTLLNECLEHKTVLFIGATGDVESRLPYFWPQYNSLRQEKKIEWKLLLKHSARHKKITKSKYYNYKILPPELDSPAVIYIYGDYVANVLWLEKPVAFVVRHRELAESYRKYFNYLWNMLD